MLCDRLRLECDGNLSCMLSVVHLKGVDSWNDAVLLSKTLEQSGEDLFLGNIQLSHSSS